MLGEEVNCALEHCVHREIRPPGIFRVGQQVLQISEQLLGLQTTMLYMRQASNPSGQGHARRCTALR